MKTSGSIERNWGLSELGLGAAIAAVLMLAAQSGWADGAFDSLTEQSITQKIGAVIKLIAGIAGIVVLSVGLLVGGIKSLNGSDDAMRWIKGGIFGGFLCFGCWALAQLFISVMK